MTNNGNRLDPKELEVITNAADDIIPADWQQYCKEPDQLILLYEIKVSYQMIIKALQKNFGGVEISSDNLSKAEIEWLQSWVDYWTDLYFVIQSSWKYIKKASLHQVDIRSAPNQRYRIYRLKENLTPGEFLVHLIEMRALSEFNECLQAFSEFSAKGTRRLLSIRQKLCSGKEVEPKDAKRLAATAKRAHRESGEFFADLFMCLEVAKVAALTDGRVREKVKRFYQKSDSMREEGVTNWSLRSYQWKKGIRNAGNNKGKTYC